MSNGISRRRLMQIAGTQAAALGAATTMLRAGPARAEGENLVGVEWGPPYLTATQAALQGYSGAKLTWEIHQNGAAAILAKIKATWPNTLYSIIDMSSPVFVSCMREGWAEPISLSDVPSLTDIPDAFFTRYPDGSIMNVPRDINLNCFAARTDTVPIDIKTIHDLFDPRLKNQIAWPNAAYNSCLHVATLAYAFGGSEHDMEPGWKALKELAKSGNIARTVANDSDFINTLTTGETSVTYSNLGTLSGAAKNVPLTYLTKRDPSMKCSVSVEGWIVLKSAKNKKAAFDLLNYLAAPEQATSFCAALHIPPASSKAKVPPGLEFATFNSEEIKKFSYSADIAYVATQLPVWQKRFEAEIVPLIGR